MTKSTFALASALTCLVALAPLYAADAPEEGLRADLFRDVQDLESKIVGLAEAIPADKYSWRPAEGVRSVSEVLGHVAAGNYFFPTLLGVESPEEVDVSGLEKISDRDEMLAALRGSFEHVEQLIAETGDDRLDETIQMFGQEATVAGALHAAISHCHEHLGQLIAYARSNGVVPPWSA